MGISLPFVVPHAWYVPDCASQLGLRLHYEIIREISPYIGINYEKKFGDSADFISDGGEDVSGTQVVAGVSFWF